MNCSEARSVQLLAELSDASVPSQTRTDSGSGSDFGCWDTSGRPRKAAKERPVHVSPAARPTPLVVKKLRDKTRRTTAALAAPKTVRVTTSSSNSNRTKTYTRLEKLSPQFNTSREYAAARLSESTSSPTLPSVRSELRVDLALLAVLRGSLAWKRRTPMLTFVQENMTALSFVKYISITPGSRKSPLELSALQTSVGETRETLDVCDSLGIDPSSLHPKHAADFQVSGARVAKETRLIHYEQLRKAKLDLVQQELAHRKHLQSSRSSAKRFVPSLPLSGTGLWRQRFDNMCLRIETAKRVLDNKNRLRSKEREQAEDKRRTMSARERKILEEKKAQRLAFEERSQKRQKHRDNVLLKLRRVRFTQIQKAQEVAALSQSPRSERNCFSAETTFRASTSARRVREEPAEVELRLSQIQRRLESGVERARLRKEAVVLSARTETERVESLSLKRKETRRMEARQRKERIRRLQHSSERHLKNKELLISGTAQRLSATSCQKERKVQAKLLSKEAEGRAREENYKAKEAQKDEQLSRHLQERQQRLFEKVRRLESRRCDIQETRTLLSSQLLLEKTRILQRHQKADATINSIRKVKSQIQVLHDRAAIVLQAERERQLAQKTRSERSFTASVPAAGSRAGRQ